MNMGGKNSKAKKSSGGKRKQNEISEDVATTATTSTTSTTTATSTTSSPSTVNAVQVTPSTTSSNEARRDETEPPASKRISIEVEKVNSSASAKGPETKTVEDKKENEKEKEKEKQPEKKIDNKKSEDEDEDESGDYDNDSDDEEDVKVDLKTTTKIDKGKEKEIQSSGEWKSDNDNEDDDNEMENEDDESQELDDKNDDEEEEVGWLEDNDELANLGTKAQALTSSGIMEARANTVQEICEFLCIEPHDAQILLQHFKWDKSELLERYSANPEKVCRDAGLKQQSKSNKPKVTSITCSICDEDVNEAQGFTALACDHYFCNNCWKDNLAIQIKDGKSIEITCMHIGCSTLVPDYVVKKLVDEDQFARYCSFASKAFVESSKMKWCPRPGCQNAVSEYASEGRCLVAKCTCGYKFCWQCNEEAHTPATCDLVVQWKKKCEDDSETYNWINSNTKPCPKCKVFIEKNDGCFQMTCRNCKFQWCWLCCEDWKSHGDHFSCNKYKGYKLQNKPQYLDGKTSADSNAQALDRYLHYYNRYINHYNSLKFEDKTREKAREKMKQLLNQNHDNFYYNVNFIEEALTQLLDCRRTLKWTYVWAYYETDPLKKELFEFGQASLESITEKLSRMLEQPVEQITNTDIQHLTRVAKQSLHNLFLSDRD
eukprot:TRINITY_DN919_c0_g2_i2.p1 TRINITY_DN919_c0_g2~~TRINITY_DN919_c0_g2_i2.p1  ORF type:complete len:658 (+),score=162.13 TRINITY_DN919_c0_g2_i2:115-2088(+)